MAIIPKGCEPENVQKRIELLFSKLDVTYPDGVVRSLQRDQKKWAETALEIARQLGYDSGNEFLIAYGYTIERAKAGRHSSTDASEVIAELKRRYPDGMPFSKMSEVEKANPDLRGKLKTIQNNADTLFSMSLKDYLLEQGLFKFGDKKSQLDNLLDQLKQRYPEGSELPVTTAKLKEDNDDLPVSRLSFIREVYGVTVNEHLRQIGLLPPEAASGPVDPQSGRYIHELSEDKANEAYLRLLKARYSDKAPLPTKVSELSTENPDIPVRRLNKYLREKGEKKAERYYIRNRIMQGKDTDLQEFTYCMLSFEETVEGFGSKQLAYLAGENEYVMGDLVVVPFGFFGCEVGEVTEVIRCLGIDAPWPVASTKEILRKVKPEEVEAHQLIFTQEDQNKLFMNNGANADKPLSNPDWADDFLEQKETKPDGTIFGYAMADQKEFSCKSKVDLREKSNSSGDDWIPCEFRFRGLAIEVAKLKRYAKQNRIHISWDEALTEEVREIRVIANDKTMDLIEKFPALKATGLVEEWFRQEVYVMYSESGFSGITNMEFGGNFDRRHDGGEGRWEWEYDMMDPVDVRFRWLQTGYSQRVHYRYPFKDKWNQNNYTREVNGVIYAREDGGSN